MLWCLVLRLCLLVSLNWILLLVVVVISGLVTLRLGSLFILNLRLLRCRGWILVLLILTVFLLNMLCVNVGLVRLVFRLVLLLE